ncbi:MAG: malto-oligosyltrehalose trehalohydrolase [Gammaproteobacteria bacterium]|nr:malto-oligosyltrehalose trehalohydrolase [Gammaproteobacteria bacterium]
MPFGAAVLPGLGTRFRLWAPTARRIELLLERSDAAAVLAMSRGVDGWYEALVPQAGHGSLYRYRVNDALLVPDPASRCNPHDVGGPSMVVDPMRYRWHDAAWRGRPWHEAVIYEVHVGTVSAAGTFRGLEDELDRLVELGVTAVELMPIADFPGARGWGYDGVLPFAPDAGYGSPEDLKRLVDAGHARGLMMLLDVVYNHFGPEGNYLHDYAGTFFSERHHTPWGSAINFDGPGSAVVRRFFIDNALYWLEEFHFDGLRFDAVHAIRDDGDPPFLIELAARVRAAYGGQRHVHLILENDDNAAHLLDPQARGPARFDAQWNDDFHHCLHTILTGERDGHYADYAGARYTAHRRLARVLGEGFAYQGEVSPHRGGRPRGEPSSHLPSTAFVSFLQNHDQVGNRACGERLDRLAPRVARRAALAVLLLAPQIPLLFMGEEWQAPEPFQYFCDFEPGLAAQVTDGRRREFAGFAGFEAADARALIPDPAARATFERSRLDRGRARHAPHAGWWRYTRRLLALRREHLVPRLAGTRGVRHEVITAGLLHVEWRMGDGSTLALYANLDAAPVRGPALPEAPMLFATSTLARDARQDGCYPPWFVAWVLTPPRSGREASTAPGDHAFPSV